MHRNPTIPFAWARLGLLALLAATAPAVLAQDDKSPPDGERGDASPPDRIRPFGAPNAPGGPGGPGGAGGPSLPPPAGQEPKGDGPRKEEPPSATVTQENGNGGSTSRKVPCVPSSAKVSMDFNEAPLSDVIKYMAEITCRNFILGDNLNGKVTIISHQQVSVAEAYEAFLSALEVAGYTTVTVGKATKVVTVGDAAKVPLKVYEGDDIPGTDNYVTQIIQLENVAVSEISSVVKELAGGNARVIAYAPTNTLILTDAAYNIRRVYRIIMQLDVASPRSHLEIVPLRYATASDVETIIEEVFGVTATSSSGSSSSGSTGADRAAARRKKKDGEATGGGNATSTTIGAEGSYISKILSDERTNSLIVLANDEAMKDVKDLVAKVDVDVDPSSRSQIHVIYLENAKASDVSQVLSDLANSRSGGGSRSSSGGSRSGSSGSRPQSSGGNSGRSFGGGGGGGGGGGMGGPREPGGAPGDTVTGVAAAFQNGSMRVTADENTNSLVVIASPEDYRIIRGVIDKLDIMRRQVFVEATVVEVGSEDALDLGVAYHGGVPGDDGGVSVAAGQFNASSLSLTTDALSGLAVGVFGDTIDLPTLDTSTGETTTLSIPMFGVALQALATNSGVEILSNPSLLIVDNEEAKITVGRNVPFPSSTSYTTGNQAIQSFQREDVGITLKVTPQINEANFVTLEISLEVAEVEDSGSSLSELASSGGPTTSKRETENTVVVQDNQTIVIGGLIGTTQTKATTKVPILGDIPLLGVLFRGNRDTSRKTNLLIFLTPHVINEPADLQEVYRVKWAQRETFLNRFYGKSRDEQEAQLREILRGTMNLIDEPSVYRTKDVPVDPSSTVGGGDPTAPAEPTP